MIHIKQVEQFKNISDKIDNMISNITSKYYSFKEFDLNMDENNLEDLREYRKKYNELSNLMIDLEIEVSKT